MTMLALLLLLLLQLGNGQNYPPNRCPLSHFTENGNKTLELPADPVPVKLLVWDIDYGQKTLEAYDPENCLPKLFLGLNSSSFYPFILSSYSDPTNVTFFNCSSVGQRHLRNSDQTRSDAPDMLSCPIYVVDGSDGIVESDLVSCTKLFDQVLPVSAYAIQENRVQLEWSDTDFDCGCFVDCKKPGKEHKSIILAVTGGISLLVLVLGAFYRICRYFWMKVEEQERVETFLKDYRALKPARFSYADVKRITHQFKDKLGEGAHGVVYKGKLSNQILVAVKILNNTDGDGEDFINEVGTMGKIHHVNVVRLLGYCADGFRRALVYDFFPKGSLQNFISSSNIKDTFLGWNKLQQIAQGIAKGIEYLHQGCDHRILHFDINPHNVLLDDNFTPKISDFGLAKLCSKNESIVSMTAARGTLGYMAPEVFSRNFGNVSHKSDIYSYGMLLLEMVGGRKNINTSQETFQVLYPDWMHSLLEGGEDTHIPIDEEGDFRIAKKLAIVGLWCIQWHPANRPSIRTVLQMMEGEGDKLKVPPNPFGSAATTSTSATVPTRRLNLELEMIPESD